MITKIFRILLGLIFLASAGLKCYPIEFFELVIQDTVHPSAAFSVYLSRFIIGIEFFLGWVLLFRWQERFWLKISAILLIAFSIQNFVLYLNQGDEGNCGCFGLFLRFTPIESLNKNLILLFINLFVLFFAPFDHSKKWQKIVSFSGATLIVLPFILFPPWWYTPAINTDSVKQDFPIELSELPSKTNYKEGKHILAFFSSTCLHCIKASYTLQIVKKEITTPPVYAFFVGPIEEMDSFFEKSNSNHKSYYIDNKLSKKDIIKITNGKFPVVFLIENNKVIKIWRGNDITTDNINLFLNDSK